MGNSLFHNASPRAHEKGLRGDFEDRTMFAGVGVGRWAWSSDSWDFDHDGFVDLYVVNGMISGPLRYDLNSFFWRQAISRSPDEARPSREYELGWGAINELIRTDRTWSGYERNVFYANNGDGTFSDVSGVLGLDFIEDGRAFALADFDLDGRQEVFLKNRNAPQLRVLKNIAGTLPPSIAFRLSGTKSNRDAIGAIVTLKTDLGLQIRCLRAGSGFLSQHSKDLYFGVGSAKELTASILWPSGAVQELQHLPINHRLWIEEGTEPSRIEPFRPAGNSDKFNRISAQSSEALPDVSETWLLPPIAAPDFSLRDHRTGRMHSLAALRGKPTLLHFCALSDERTEKDWSAFAQRHANWTTNGLQLVSVVFDDGVGPKRSTSSSSSAFPFPS